MLDAAHQFLDSRLYDVKLMIAQFLAGLDKGVRLVCQRIVLVLGLFDLRLDVLSTSFKFVEFRATTF